MGSNYSASWKDPVLEPTSDLDSLPFPVWGTQGGGLARLEGGSYIWHEPPEWAAGQPGMSVGDRIPEEWGLAPANDTAQDILHGEIGEGQPMVFLLGEGECDGIWVPECQLPDIDR